MYGNRAFSKGIPESPILEKEETNKHPKAYF
jgi:hypothetical protein